MKHLQLIGFIAASLASANVYSDRAMGRSLTWDQAEMVPLEVDVGQLSPDQTALIKLLKKGETNSVIPASRKLMERDGDLIAAWCFVLAHKVRGTVLEAVYQVDSLQKSPSNLQAIDYAKFRLKCIRWWSVARSKSRTPGEYEALEKEVKDTRKELVSKYSNSLPVIISACFDASPGIELTRSALESCSVDQGLQNWVKVLKCRAYSAGAIIIKGGGKPADDARFLRQQNMDHRPDLVRKYCSELRAANFEIGKVMYYEGRALVAEKKEKEAIKTFQECLKRNDITAMMRETATRFIETRHPTRSFYVQFDE